MTQVGVCPHCRAANSYTVTECLDCKQPLPWANAIKQQQQALAQAQADINALKQAAQNSQGHQSARNSQANASRQAAPPAPGQPLPINPFHIFIDAFLGRFSQSFEYVDKQSALWIGVICAFIYNVCLIAGTYLFLQHIQASMQAFFPLIPPVPSPSDSLVPQADAPDRILELWKLAALSVTPMLAVTISCTIARKLFGGEERWIEGDIFIAGISLLPAGFFFLGMGLLGIGNVEAIAIGFVFAICYTITLLYRGLTTVSKVRDMAAALCVPLVLILSMWLVKVISTRLLTF